eukprot:COSAG02_NODE_5803_length_4024_cov_60.505700_2_plen_55_part_00
MPYRRVEFLSLPPCTDGTNVEIGMVLSASGEIDTTVVIVAVGGATAAIIAAIIV